MFMRLLLLDVWFIMETKIVWKFGCKKYFMELYGQTLTTKYKGLTVEAETKFLLKIGFQTFFS